MKIPQVIRDKPWTRKACLEVIPSFLLLLLLLCVSVPGAFLRLVVVHGSGLIGGLLCTNIHSVYSVHCAR